MTKINQIQKELKAISGGAFQKLADAYLYKKGYSPLKPIGSVVGADKVQPGTPDTLVPLENGKYIFIEHTTTQSGLYGKLEDDLDKCFNEDKIGIPVEKIAEVVFCHNSNLNPNEIKKLAKKCQSHEVNLNIFGIGDLSFELYRKYPGIARDHLGIEMDTGQIVDREEFVSLYNNQMMATPLDTNFHFREEEVNQALKALERDDLIIISGKPGVGKTRFGLECCKQFRNKNPEYIEKCIFSRGPSIFKDLKIYFSEPNSYLIFVDDANRINQFEYIFQLLPEANEKKQIKIIATVRDYALKQIEEDIPAFYERVKEIELQVLEDEQIKDFLEQEYDIKNSLYKERISEIARGNPRLAVMAARVVKKEGNDLSNIAEASVIYDKYYKSIRQDLEALTSSKYLKVIGIVVFFRVIDRTNEKMIANIEEIFEISLDEFWEAVEYLYDLEILDIYENEVVKISDQVLRTYLFYLVYFKTEEVEFSVLLENFFPDFKSRFSNTLTPVINIFDREFIVEKLRPHVRKIWDSLESNQQNNKLFKFVKMFYFVDKTKALLYVQNQISKMAKNEVDWMNITLNKNSNILSSSILQIISQFSSSAEDELTMALDLLLDYLNKRPNEFSKVLYVLTKKFGFKHTSYLFNFKTQKQVINTLWRRVQNSQKEKLFLKLFLMVANEYLKTRFDNSRSGGRFRIDIIKFSLPAVPSVINLRKSIWEKLFKIYNETSFKQEVLNIIYEYSTSGYLVSVNEIIKRDKVKLIEFIENNLTPDEFYHCYIVQTLLDFFQRKDIPIEEEVKQKFRSDIYKIFELLTNKWAEKRSELNAQKYEKFKRRKFKEYFQNYNFDDFHAILNKCLEINQSLNQERKLRSFQTGIKDILLCLAEHSPELYVKVIKYYFELGDPFNFRSCSPVKKLIKICGHKKAYNIINQFKDNLRDKWSFCFYRTLPQSSITEDYLNELYSFYQEAEKSELPNGLHFLLKYNNIDDQAIVRVTDIILKKANNNPSWAYALSFLFNSKTQINQKLIDLFEDNFEVLKEAYLAVERVEEHMDYQGKTFKRMIDFNSDFFFSYIDWMYNKEEFSSRYDGKRDYSFLWEYDSYKELMKEIIVYIYEKEASKEITLIPYVTTFFISDSGNLNEKIKENQNELLEHFIKQKYTDLDFMKFIFKIIVHFSRERRLHFFSQFIRYNDNLEDFKKLSLEPQIRSWWGSAAPMHRKRVNYFESIRQLFDNVKFLEHRQYMESRIKHLRGRIEQEKKNDFIRND